MYTFATNGAPFSLTPFGGAWGTFLATTRIARTDGTITDNGWTRGGDKWRDLMTALAYLVDTYGDNPAAVRSLSPAQVGRMVWSALLDNITRESDGWDTERIRSVYLNDDAAGRQFGRFILDNLHFLTETPADPQQVTSIPAESGDLTARFLYRRSDGKIVWAQGWSQNGVAFDAYERSRDNQTGTNIGVGQYRDYAELMPGLPIEMVNPGGSHRYGYATNVGDVTYFARLREGDRGNYAIGVHRTERFARAGQSDGYVGVNHVRVKVHEVVSVEPTVIDADPTINVGGIEYVRKDAVERDNETLLRMLHEAAEHNGLCEVFDKTMAEIAPNVSTLTLHGRTRRRSVWVRETYTLVRRVDVDDSTSQPDAQEKALRADALTVWNLRDGIPSIGLDRIVRESITPYN